MDGSTLTFAQLVNEVRPWSDRNFPGKQPWQPLLGCIEEAGEMAHALLKLSQGIRGDEAKHRADLIDSVADLTIFLADFYGLLPGSPDELELRDPLGSLHRGMIDAGRSTDYLVAEIAKRAAKCLQDYHQHPGSFDRTLGSYLLLGVARFCMVAEIDYGLAVARTWDQVKQRDWRKNPADGVAEATP